ncbi:MAG: ral nucleoside transport system permease protein [Gaiellaceae bacterium]|jgi:simple sugar transport system permease protein|nr:ral nucleoside transport system permease protein [Gaiellaceae bacterium]
MSATTITELEEPGRRFRLRHVELSWARAGQLALRVGWWIALYGLALVIFGAFAASRHVDPIAMYRAMWEQTIVSPYGLGQVIDKMAPFALAALAVAVPARAGLVNIGGEGQIVLGAVGAGGVSLALGTHLTGGAAIVLMMVAGAGAGALWAGIAAALRLAGGVNEAISTLLLNYVGADVLAYLVYGSWKDASGNGQPASKPLPAADYLPVWGRLQAHIGFLIAIGAAIAIGIALRKTRWGFKLRAVGGNPEAARRAGLRVKVLLLSAMLVGGALAGLAGAVHYAGMEGQLRPGVAATFGYTGFLASWLARHQPAKVIAAAFLLASIAVAGNAIQLSSHLPGSAVNILMAVVLLAVLARRPKLVRA